MAQFAPPSNVPPNSNLNPCYCSPAASDGSYACFNFNAATSDINCNPRGNCFPATAVPGEYSIQAGGPVFKCGTATSWGPDNPCPESQRTVLGGRWGDRWGDFARVYTTIFTCPGFPQGAFCTPLEKDTTRTMGPPKSGDGGYGVTQYCMSTPTTATTGVGVVNLYGKGSGGSCDVLAECTLVRPNSFCNAPVCRDLMAPADIAVS